MILMTDDDAIPITLNNYSSVAEVKEFDVLCGSKNNSLNRHRGNLLLRQRVSQHLDEYEQAKNKQDKMDINRAIIKYMRSKYGSRFLRQRGNGDWVEVDEQCVRDKVSHAVRFAYTQREKEREYQQQRAPSRFQHVAVPTTMSAADNDDEDPVFAQMIGSVFERQQEILQDMMHQKSTDDHEDGIGAPK